MAAETTGFLIGGTIYEVPGIDTFDMDEAQVLYDYSGLTLENFAVPVNETEEQAEERQRVFKNPAFMRALMHIAYQREHREMKREQVGKLIGEANMLAAMASLDDGEDEEGDALPPASTTEPEQSSESGSVEPSRTSGADSTNGLDQPASGLHRIGTTRSDMSSPESRTSPSVV